MEKGKKHSGCVALKLEFQGQKGEELPRAAVYRIDRRGQPIEKLAVATEDTIDLDRAWLKRGDRVAFGPDAELEDLLREQLVEKRLSQLLQTQDRGEVLVFPAERWELWPFFRVCVHGQVRACRSFFPPIELPNPGPILLPTPMQSFLHLPKICGPVCDGVVEIYEKRCCCRPWIIVDELLDRFRDIVDGPFPIDPPIPPGPIGPGPRPPEPLPPGPFPPVFDVDFSRATRQQMQPQKVRLAQGKEPKIEKVPDRVLQDVRVLRALPREAALQYVIDRLYLWPLVCSCTTKKIGEAVLQPDGTFDFCFFRPPQILPPYPWVVRCTSTYAYKVKQLQEGVWVTLYDGVSENEYFAQSENANITFDSTLARTCGEPDEPVNHNRDFVLLDKVGFTSTHVLHSPLQASVLGLNQPIVGTLIGLHTAGSHDDCPWGATLPLRLHFSEGMKDHIGVEGKAKYYRLSVARANSAGNPDGDWRVLSDPVTWEYYEFDPIAFRYHRKTQPLGPLVKDGEEGLFLIPDGDKEWRGVQFHQSWDTTIETGANSSAHGRYLLRVEVFDKNGNKLKPSGSVGVGNEEAFDFLRLSPGTELDVVPYSDLVHAFWLDNRPCLADISALNITSADVPNEDCLFLEGPGGAEVSTLFKAGHYGGAGSGTFMRHYTLSWRRGFNNVFIDAETGYDDHPSPLSAPPAASDSLTVDQLLGDKQRCTFTINLRAWPKTRNGISYVTAYEAYDQASFALSRSAEP